MTKRVLIVDDEWRTLEGEAQRVARCGLDVEVVGLAENAAKALDLVRQAHPDIVLCDIHMPDMDGIAFTIQAKELDPSLAVIFISGYSDKEYLRTAIRIGVVDYLFKPVDDAEFLAAMRRAMERNDQARAQGQAQPALIDQAIFRTLLQSNDEALLQGILPQMQGQYVVVYAAPTAMQLNDLTRQQLNMFALHMTSSLSQAQGLRYTSVREQYAITLLVGQDWSEDSLETRVQAVCEAMLESLPEARSLLSIGIGGQYDALAQTSRSFAEAVEAHRLTFFAAWVPSFPIGVAAANGTWSRRSRWSGSCGPSPPAMCSAPATRWMISSCALKTPRARRSRPFRLLPTASSARWPISIGKSARTSPCFSRGKGRCSSRRPTRWPPCRACCKPPSPPGGRLLDHGRPQRRVQRHALYLVQRGRRPVD